jgi:hypothetical protein
VVSRQAATILAVGVILLAGVAFAQDASRTAQPPTVEVRVEPERLELSAGTTEGAPPGERTLTFRVRTQACDQSRCLPPRTTKLALRITVVGDASAADKPRHAVVFDNVDGR